MNQPSLFDVVVPVLPATGRPICAAVPVPDRTADCRRSVISAATHGATRTRFSSDSCWYSWRPSAVTTRRIAYGDTATPLSATEANAFVISSNRTSLDPSTIDG